MFIIKLFAYIALFSSIGSYSIAGEHTSERYKRGIKEMEKFHKSESEKLIKKLEEISPDMAKYVVEYPFGDVYNRPGLDLKSRQVGTIAGLTALGAAPQLKIHIKAGLNAGLTKEEIMEVIIQMSVYAGFPRALNALFVAHEVFDEMEKNQ